jgi:hypothetical protein
LLKNNNKRVTGRFIGRVVVPEGLFLRYNQSSSTVIPGGKPDLVVLRPAVARSGSEEEFFFVLQQHLGETLDTRAINNHAHVRTTNRCFLQSHP